MELNRGSRIVEVGNSGEKIAHLPETRYDDIVMPKRFTKTVSKYTAELNPLAAAISRWVRTEPLSNRFTLSRRNASIESRTLCPVIWRNL